MKFTGERFVPEVHGNIELEHLHRYLLACKTVVGKTVLDIASGEGYGSAMLARTAHKVIGVDISQEAVSHAQAKYKAKNLEFRLGLCSVIPLDDASVDMVVSFETIEHHNEHESMMKEIKRVLRPGGVLVISSPDKFEYSDKPGYSNPHHVKELSRDEFKKLLNLYFENHSIYGQRVVYGSAIFCEDGIGPIESYELTDDALSVISGVPHAVYLIAVASDSELYSLGSGILEQPINETELVQAWAGIVAEREALLADKDSAWSARLEQTGKDYMAEIVRIGAERDALLADKDSAWSARLEQTGKDYMAEIVRIGAERDAQIAALYNSTRWRIAGPLRFITHQIKRVRRIAELIKPAIERGDGLYNTTRKAIQLYQREGVSGIKRGFKTVAVAEHTSGASFGSFAHDPLVSIIVVSYNSGEDLAAMLPTLAAQNYGNFELILVENGSQDTESIVRSFFPDAIYLRPNGNVGFAAGNNIGLRAATGELIALLNPDTELERDWLLELVHVLRHDGSSAVAVPKLRFFHRFIDVHLRADGNFRIDTKQVESQLHYKKWFVTVGSKSNGNIYSDETHSVILRLPVDGSQLMFDVVGGDTVHSVKIHNGRTRPKVFTRDVTRPDRYGICVDLRSESNSSAAWLINNAGSMVRTGGPFDRGFGEYDYGQYDTRQYVDAMCGCAALIRRVAILERDLFLDEFFAYYEDAELSYWLDQKGHKITYAPQSVVRHKHSASSNEGSLVWQTLTRRSKDIYDVMTTAPADRMQERLADIEYREYEHALPASLKETLRKFDIQFLARMREERQLSLGRVRVRVGIYNSYWNTRGGGELHALSFAVALQSACDVYLLCEEDFDATALAGYFGVDLASCRKLIISKISPETTTLFDVFVNSTYNSTLVSKAAKSFYLVSFPMAASPNAFLRAYTFLHNSNYTLSWASHYWGSHEHKVLLPILNNSETGDQQPAVLNKERLLLAVGRITARGHCKNLHEIVRTFCNARDSNAGVTKWGLVVCGSLDVTNADDLMYFSSLQTLAQGQPILLQPNCNRTTLDAYFGKSTIYIHATGLGRNPDTEPELHEHFGITVFEAVAAGCIPLVYHIGGPAELLDSCGIGRVFRDNDSLCEELCELIAAAERDGLAAQVDRLRSAARSMRETNSQTVEGVLQEISSS